MTECYTYFRVIMVKKKDTNEILERLTASKSFSQFVRQNQDDLITKPLTDYLNQLLQEKGMSKPEVIRRAEMNEIYGYQIFAGKRQPSRDKLIALSLGFQLALDEIQQLLKYSGAAPLYPKNKRDAIIIFGILHGKGIVEINDQLYDEGMKTLD